MRPELKIYSVRGNCDYASFAPPDGLAAFGGVLFYYTHGNLYNVKTNWIHLLMRHVHAVRTQRFMDIPTVLAARSGAVWCFSTPARFPGAGARQLWCGHGGKRRAAF